MAEKQIRAQPMPDGIAPPMEVEGQEVNAALTVPKPIKAARRLSIIERPMQDAEPPTVQENKLLLKLKPHEILTLGILLD